MLTQLLSRENMEAVWKRIKVNTISAGVNGLSINQTVDYPKDHWPKIRAELFADESRPQPVRRVEIPKPGGGKRELGRPAVVDCLISTSSAYLNFSNRPVRARMPVGAAGVPPIMEAPSPKFLLGHVCRRSFDPPQG